MEQNTKFATHFVMDCLTQNQAEESVKILLDLGYTIDPYFVWDEKSRILVVNGKDDPNEGFFVSNDHSITGRENVLQFNASILKALAAMRTEGWGKGELVYFNYGTDKEIGEIMHLPKTRFNQTDDEYYVASDRISSTFKASRLTKLTADEIIAHYSKREAEQVETEVLPERWAVLRTPENAAVINEWANKQDGYGGPTQGYAQNSGFIYSDRVKPGLSLPRYAYRRLLNGFTEITFDQFKRLVLKQEPTQAAKEFSEWVPKKGDYVVCHTDLVMDDPEGEVSASVGKSYEVYKADNREWWFKDDQGDDHSIHVSTQRTWFRPERFEESDARRQAEKSEHTPLTYGGDIADFPVEIVNAMLDEQERQGNKRDVVVFELIRFSAVSCKGFKWEDTYDGLNFWERVIGRKDFAHFFARYPKAEEQPAIETGPSTVAALPAEVRSLIAAEIENLKARSVTDAKEVDDWQTIIESARKTLELHLAVQAEVTQCRDANTERLAVLEKWLADNQ